jgi:predicted Zn-dependent protease
MKRYEEALSDIDALIRLIPGSIQYRIMKADLLSEMGKREMALQILKESSEMFPDSDELKSRIMKMSGD